MRCELSRIRDTSLVLSWARSKLREVSHGHFSFHWESEYTCPFKEESSLEFLGERNLTITHAPSFAM